MNPDRALDEFTQLVKSPEIDLGVAALAIARIEHPDLAPGPALARAEAEAIASRAVGRSVNLTDAHFSATSRTQIVARMLRNLEGIYARSEDWTKALAVIDRLLVVDADAPTHRRDRGTVLVKLGELHRGASEWERYLTRYPQARDAAAFREELRRVRQTLAEKN